MITQRVKGRRFDKRVPFMHRAIGAEYSVLNALPLHQRSIAFFTEVYSPIINGVVASVDGLSAALRDAHDDVTIYAPHFPRAKNGEAGVVRLPSLPLPTSTGYRLCVPFVPHAARERLQRAQIVHVHSPFVTGHLGANIARRQSIPLVFTYHTRLDEYAHYAPFAPALARAMMMRLTREFANRADVVIAPTAAMRDRLRELGVMRSVMVVPSSIDVARFRNAVRTDVARTQLGARDGQRVVLIVARIAKEKQLELAVDALSYAHDVRLAIVGDGPQRSELEQRARARGVLERITFTGAVEPAVMPALYAASDAFALTSVTETQGLVLAEALAAGLPVVAADTPVNREGAAGFAILVNGGPPAFAAALAEAVAAPRNPVAAEDAARRFGRPAQAAAVQKIYGELLSERF
jgi:glycosyltransferase involved in cell wall biosynthesis